MDYPSPYYLPADAWSLVKGCVILIFAIWMMFGRHGGSVPNRFARRL